MQRDRSRQLREVTRGDLEGELHLNFLGVLSPKQLGYTVHRWLENCSSSFFKEGVLPVIAWAPKILLITWTSPAPRPHSFQRDGLTFMESGHCKLCVEKCQLLGCKKQKGMRPGARRSARWPHRCSQGARFLITQHTTQLLWRMPLEEKLSKRVLHLWWEDS